MVPATTVEPKVGPFDKNEVSNLGSTTEEEPVVVDVVRDEAVEDLVLLWSLRPSVKLFKFDALGCVNFTWLTWTTVGGTTSFFEPVKYEKYF